MAQTTLITGASSGLGEELARQLAARGHDLALCARRGDRLERLRTELTGAHPAARVAVRSLDVDDHDRVPEVFRELAGELGGVDRVVVNAGIGSGAPLGTGRPEANRAIATTNFVSALAQTEAAMELFRAQGAGHLVVVSSIAARRGMPGGAATYAASKAGLAHLAEGVRAEVHGSAIRVTVLYPGFIVSGMNPVKRPLVASTRRGVAAMVRAIEKERASASVPAWPWVPLGFALGHLPLPLARRLMG
jgi:short-subunit dehydrogenase